MRYKSKSQSWSRAVTAAIISLGLVPLAIFNVVGSSLAGADASVPAFYLDLGGSASVGVQPTLVDPRGQATVDGYANELVTFEAARGVPLQLTELGCPGETTLTMVGGGDHCNVSPGTQLVNAVSFLTDHPGQAGIVTLDLGFNDLRPCLGHPFYAQSCVKHQVSQIEQQLPTILAVLKNVAGPTVSLVGLGHYDPFLADSLLGSEGRSIAYNSNLEVDRLNAVLQSIYANAGIPMAMVGTAFEIRNVAIVTVAGGARMRQNVTSTCTLTWMCQPAPLGPNIHPNDAGYAAIALAIENVLKAPWTGPSAAVTSTS